MKLSNAMKKGISVLLALNLVLSSAPVPTFAVGEEGLCDHHTEHTPECGYAAAVAGSPCSHTHDDTCGYIEAVEGVSCACQAGEDGTLIHEENCGYVEAVAGSPCTHIHDELCGYAEAVEGQPCGYECGECAAAAEAYSDLGIGYICAAGNGDSSLGNWVNGESWYIEAESNIMTEVAANVYEITYTDLPASDNYALKFAADGVWDKSWGGTYNGSGVESDAELGGPEISFPVFHGGSDVTLKLDLTGYDPDTQTGATFTVTVILPEEAGYTYDEETNTCTVTTANGLYHVAELVNNVDSSINITLAADIVLNENLADKVTVAEDGTVSADASVRTWTPPEGEYSGTFDGGNHTITGLYCADNGHSSTGLIGTLAEGATVKNVKIHDFCLERDGGAVVGNNRGEVTGCSISGTGILGWTTGYQYVGGVVGLNEGTVEDCTGSATLTFRGMGYFGGIVGYNITSQATVIGCSNSGTITAAGNSYMKVGGILGGEMGTVKDCYHTGSIRATVEDGSVQVGGIVGWMKGTVSGCYNTGDISGDATFEGTGAYVGGIAGYAEGPVSGCYNTAAVSGDATGESACIYVSGIAGFVQNTVSGCYNTGIVSGDATGDYSSAYMGGITSTNNGTVSDCYNTAAISGDATGEYAETCVGGIAGVSNTTVSGCYNIGSIDSGTYSGSIAALAYGGTFADCYYLDTCVETGSPEHSSADGITEKSAAQFASGEVAYLLNGDQSTITYTQTLGSDAAPSFTGGTVYRVGVTCTEGAEAYANTQSDLDHNYTDGICTACLEVCDHSGSTNTAVTDRGNGTHGYTCTVCGAAVTEDHAMDVTTGKCGECGAAMTAIATVTDGTNTRYAADAATLNQAVTAILETGSRTFTVELPADAEAGMITTIRRAICDTEGVDDGSIHLTLKGVTSIPESNYDGIAFGLRNAQWDENNVEIVSHEEVTQLASVNLPDVTEIGAQAFYFCENLVTVSAPKAQTIGAQAFGYTALTSVEFPELTTIPTDMFSGTWTLSSAKFPKVTTIEQNGLLIGGKFTPENNPTPFPLELTAEGDITFNGSNHFNIAERNYTGKVDLVLCCDKKDAVTFHDDGTATWQVREDLSYTFKSITIKQHSYVDGKCTACGEDCAHTGGEATCTAPAVCITCGTSYGEKKPHSFNDSGFCTVCNTAAQAKLVANSDGTVTYFATLPEALAAEHNPWDEVYALADYEGDITIPAGLCFYGENHTFSGDVLVEGGRIFSGTFNGEVQVYLLDTVEDGVTQGFIYGGTFRNAVSVGSQCVVYGGTFEAELELGGCDVFNFAGDEYHFALGENFALILGGDTTIDCQEHFEPLGFDCTVGKLCRLCREVLTDPQAAHTGSNSTCSTEGACQVCGTLYLDPDVHAGERTNGIWTCCGKYQIPEQDADGVYEIDNAGKLFWFAAQVNSGNVTLNARLTADIDLKNRPWTPIGNVDNFYKGSFDGSGKTIKGLYIHDEAANYVGLFGAVYQNGHVKAVTLTDSSVTGKDYVGGIAGFNRGTVTGCVNNAVVSGSGTSIGGIAGENSGTVELCGNTNTVTSSRGSGGIAGRSSGTIRNCYNTGEVRGTGTTGNAGGITYLNMGTVEYSWSTGKVTGGSNGEEGGIVGRNTDAVRYCCATQKAIDTSQYGSTTNNVGTYTADRFASGEVAYLLGDAWGQTIGTDPYPVLGGAQVYHGYTSCGDTAAVYTNDETVSPEKPPHTGEADYTPTGDGKQHKAKWSCCGTEVTEAHSGGTATCQTKAVCQHCGESYGDLDPDNHEYETNNGICCDTYQSATLNAEGYYEIFNAGQLYWFAQQVIGGGYGLNAKLVNNITLNENLLNDSYGLNSGDFRTWTPMGDFFNGYSGTFDGQGYVISGLYIPSTNTIQGMFSVVTGTVKNVILADTYVQGAGQDGGLVGYLRGGTVSNCGFDGVVKSVASGGSAGSYTAGVVAYTYGGTIENCFATGKIHSEGDHANPVFAYADTNAGALTLTNNYYLENCSTDSTGTVNAVHCNDGVYATTEAQIASVTEEQILSGEVAYLLGGAWGQTIGTDSYPVLGGAKVYKIKICEKTAYSNTEGDVPHNYVNGFCTAIPGEIHYQPAPDSDSDGFFEIGNAGQMFWFANHINTVDRTASAVLTADIDLEGRPWTPIGSTGESSNNFRGTFDGQNHTIRGLYVEGGRAGLGFFGEVRTGTVKNFTIYGEVVANTEVNYVGGVFGSICGLNGENDLERNGAVIQNITSYVNLTAKVHGIGMIGGFVGYANHQSLIENCAWYGTFDAGIYRVDTGAGGFIGKIQENSSEVTIRNCGAYGTIKTNYAKNSYNNTPTIYMGGFLSFSNTNAKTTLENCLFAGKFERGANLTDQAFLGAFGTLRSVNAIKNCYYLGDDGLEAVHSDSNLKPGSDNVEITSVTGEQLLSGEIAYKLGSAWGQTIGTDDYPIPGGRKVYYGYADCKATEKTYANSPMAETELVHSFNANGFCSVCDEYEPASDAEADGYYEIDNAGKLYWFAAQVNGGKTAINGKLIENITVNENVLNANGEPNSGDFRAWTPIVKSGNSYTGTFDGNGKTISGLYFNDSTTNYVGLFGVVSSGTVQNVGVIDSYLHGNKCVGGVVGYNSSGTVQNCYNTGSVSGTSYYVGGVVGYNYGTVTGCYNTGSVSGTYYVGGVVGWNSSGTVQNSYNTGSVSGTGYYVGGVVGHNSSSGTVKDCYNTGTVSGDQNVGGVVGYNSSSTVQNCYNTGSVSGDQNVGGVVGYNSGSIIVSNCYYDSSVYSGNAIGNSSGTITNVLGKTTEQFASGEVAYLLNGDQSTIVFKQTIGTDAAPGFTGETVYAITNCVGTGTGAYSNTKTQLPHDYSNNNGFCVVCGAYESAVLNNGYYEIDNAGKLYWFAQQVNSGYTDINGELKADIVVNEDVLAEMIRINPDPSRFRLWTPIGTGDNGYSGDFCGYEHTVSGLYFNDSTAYFVGLFGHVGSGTVSHVGVIDSYFNGSGAVGGVVGCNYGTVEYAYNTGTVKGDASVGGVVGDNYSTVKYAYNTGTVSGDFVVGGVVGSNEGTVMYAYNTGSVSGGTDVGGVAGENFDTFATVTNCYFDSTVYTGDAIGTDSGTATDVEGKTTEQFASGEVAYLLGYPFGQTIGTHFSPVLYKGYEVYYGYTSCGDVRMVYTNDSKASTEKPEHTGEATYTLTEDGAQHIASYSCCGTTVTEDHTYENGFCPCGVYDLWVAGEQISESHLTVSGTTGTATYDPATDTLTLNDFDNGEKWCSFTDDGFYFNNAAVYTISDLNVVLEGENSLYVSGGNYNAAIQSDETVTIGGDGTLGAGTIYSANGTTINGGMLNLGADIVFDGSSTTINGGNVNVSVHTSVTYGTLTVNGGRVVLETSDRGVGRYGTILIGEGMAVYDENGALIENPDFKTLQYALIRVPCDHTQATASYTWTEDPITMKVTVSCPACGETFTGSTEDIDVTISDDGFTTYTATVTLDGQEYTNSKTVTNQVTSVNIAWGSMEFIYTEDETGEGAWGSPDGANRIAVTNTGNTAVTVTAAYTQAEGYEEIKGKFFASENSTHTEPAPAGETAEFYLYLEGEPNKALKNTTVGTVTVSIQ